MAGTKSEGLLKLFKKADKMGGDMGGRARDARARARARARRPARRRVARDAPVHAAAFDAFVGRFVDQFSEVCRDTHELRYLCRQLFPLYVQPAADGDVPLADTRGPFARLTDGARGARCILYPVRCLSVLLPAGLSAWEPCVLLAAVSLRA